MLFANCHADFSRLHIWFKNTRLVKQLIEQHLPVPYPPHIYHINPIYTTYNPKPKCLVNILILNSYRNNIQTLNTDLQKLILKAKR